MTSSTPRLELLPSFTPLEPLTNGTNLPPVPASELSPPINHSASRENLDGHADKPAVSQGGSSPAPAAPAASADADEHDHASPPRSPARPTSMRRFLSRVSMNSSYNTPADDKSSIFSSPLSLDAPPDRKAKSGSSKKSASSWWKKNRRHSAIIPPVQENLKPSPTLSPPRSSNGAITSNGSSSQPGKLAASVQSIPPPPRLPDDMFGSNLSSLDAEIFKSFGTDK